ncbi:MAG: hypothetical protein ACP5NC_07385 [Nitrososphaeria archaeon]
MNNPALNTVPESGYMSEYHTHSPTKPIMEKSDYYAIYGRKPAYRLEAVEGNGEEGELWRELNTLIDLYGWRFSEADKQSVINRAKRVRGSVPVRLAVALYSVNAYAPATIESYLRFKGIDMDQFDLFHMAYVFSVREGVKKARMDRHVQFELIAPDDIFGMKDINQIRAEYNAELERALSDPAFAGKRARTIANAVLRRVLARRGLA